MRLVAICVAFFTLVSCADAQERSNRASLWEHNGSIVSMHRDGNFFVIWYQNPSEEMQAVGVVPFTNLFEGFIGKHSPEFRGKAYVFSSLCGPVAYEVEGDGEIENDRKTITLYGPAPLLNESCEIAATTTESANAQLKFYFIRFVE